MFIKKQTELFITALMYFSRIPIWKVYRGKVYHLNESIRYFSLVGIVIGCILAFFYFAFSSVFTREIATVLTIGLSCLLTGALHEDGLADVCDGFGGGWTKEQTLKIMKDSLIGAYGSIGISLLILIKYAAMLSIGKESICYAIILSSGISRAFSGSYIYTDIYVRDEKESKAKDFKKGIKLIDLFLLFLFGLFPFFILKKYELLFILLPLFLVRYLLINFFRKKIGGYTGDCLGAAQQIFEVICYLCLGLKILN